MMKMFERKNIPISGGTLYASPVKEGHTVIEDKEDKCVVCGKGSGVMRDVPIQNRERYINGSGQLCRDCYFKLYLS